MNGSGADSGGIDSRTLEVLLQYRDQGVSKGFQALDTQANATAQGLARSSDTLSDALDRQARAWQRATPPKQFAQAARSATIGSDGVVRSLTDMVRLSPKASATMSAQTAGVSKWKTQYLSLGNALGTTGKALDAQDAASRRWGQTQRAVNDILSRTNNIALDTTGKVFAMVDVFTRIPDAASDFKRLGGAVKGLGDGTKTTSERVGELGMASAQTGKDVGLLAGSTAVLARGAAAANGAMGGVAKSAISALGKISVVGAGVVSVGEGFANMSAAAQLGQSIIPPFLKMCIDLLHDLAIAIALAMGGWPAIIALAVMALEGLVKILNKVGSTYRSFAQDLIKYPIDRLLNPNKLGGDLKQGFGALWDNTAGRMADLLRKLPGPMGDAQRTMDVMFNGFVGGAKKAADGTQLLLSGLVGLGVEMRQEESVAYAYQQAIGQLGVDGKQLLDVINRESLGLISHAEAMEKVNTAIALIGTGALKSAGDFSQTFSSLAKVSMAAARATGQDVEYMFQSIVLGIGRASPMILDNLGLAFRASEAYDAYGKKLHKAAKDLTVTEQKSALLNYVLEKGNEMVERYGISTGGTNTQIQRLGVVFHDVATELSLGFGPILKDFLSALVGIASNVKLILPAFDAFFRVLKAIPEPIRNAVIAYAALNTVTGILASGPGKQLLSLFGVSGDQLAFMAGKAKYAAAGLMFLYTAYQKNYLGLKTLLEPLMRFPEMVVAAWNRTRAAQDEAMHSWEKGSAALKQFDWTNTLPSSNQMRQEGMISAGMFWKGLQDFLGKQKLSLAELFKPGASGKPGDFMLDVAQMTKLSASEMDKLKAKVSTLRIELSKIGKAGRVSLGITDEDLAKLDRLDFYFDTAGSKARSTAIELGDVRDRASDIAEKADRLGEALAGAFETARPHLYVFLGSISRIPDSLREIAAGNIDTGFKNLSMDLDLTRTSAEALLDQFVKFTQRAADIFGPDTVKNVQSGANRVLDTLRKLPGLIAGEGIALANSIGDSISTGIGNLEVVVEGLGAQVGQWLSDGIVKMDTSSIMNNILALFTAIVGNVSKIYNSLVGLFTRIYVEAATIWSKIAPAVYNALADIFDRLAEWLPQIITRVWGEFWGGFSTMVDRLYHFIVNDGGDKVVSGVVDAYKNGAIRLANSAHTFFGGLLDAVRNAKDVFFYFLSKWGPQIGAMWDQAKPIVMDALKGFLRVQWEILKNGLAILFDAIGSMLREQDPKMEGYLKDVIRHPEHGVASVAIEVGRVIGGTLINGVIAGIAEKAPGVGLAIQASLGVANALASAAGYKGPQVEGMTAQPGDFSLGVSLPTSINSALIKHPANPSSSAPNSPGLPGVGDIINRMMENAGIGQSNWNKMVGGGGGAPGPAGPGVPDPSEALGDGGGGKGGKDKAGGGSEKDPLQEAMSAISNVSSAIQAGLAAMKAVWTDWLGEPPDAMMDQVFDALDHILKRAIKLADGKLTAESAESVQAGLQALSGALSAITGVIDMSSAIYKLRPVDDAQLEAAFGLTEKIGKFAFGLLDTLGVSGGEGADMAGLQGAVKSITLAGQLAGVINDLGGAITSIADSTHAISRMRDDVDLAPLTGIVVNILKTAEAGVTEISSFAGERTIPMAITQLTQTAGALGDWSERLSGVVDLATKWDTLREPPANFLDGPKAWLTDVLKFAEDMTTSFTTQYGTGFMLKAEDAGIVGGILDPWISAAQGIIDAAAGMQNVRSNTDLAPARVWLGQILGWATELSATLAGPKILRVTDDVKAVGESLAPWTELLGGLGDVAAAAASVMVNGQLGVSLGQSKALLGDLIDFVLGDLPGWIAALGPKPGLAMGDLKMMGESLGPYADLLGGLADVAASAEAMTGARNRGVSVDFRVFRDILTGLGEVASALVSGAIAHYGLEKVARESWDNAKALGDALAAWTGLFGGMGEVVGAARSVAKYGAGASQAIETGLDLLEYLAIGAYTRFGRSLNRVGAQEGYERSQALATTLVGWRDLFAGMDEFTIGLRRAAHGATGFGAKVVVTQMVDLLDFMSIALWQSFQRAIRSAESQATSEASGALASAVSGWVELISNTVELTRTLREVKPWRQGDLTGVLSLVETLRAFADRLYDTLAGDPLPGDTLDVEQKQIGVLAAMVEMVSGAAGLGRTLAEAVTPSNGEIASVVLTVRTLWESAQSLGGYITDLVEWGLETAPRIEAFSTAFGQIMSVITSTVGLDTTRYVMPTPAEVKNLVSGVRSIWEGFRDLLSWMPSIDRGSADATERAAQWQAWSQSVGAVLQVVTTASQMYIDRGDVGLITAGTIRVVRDNLSLVFRLFEGLANDWADAQRVPEIAAGRIQAWSSSATAVLGAVTGALELGKSLSGQDVPKLDWSGGGVPPIIARLGDIVGAVVGMFDDLSRAFEKGAGGGTGDPNRARALAESALGYISAYSGVAQSATQTLSGLTGLLVTLTDQGHKVLGISPVTKGVLGQAIRDIVGLFDDLGKEFNISDISSRASMDRVAEFATNVNTIMAPIKTAVDTITSLNDFLWEIFTPQEGEAPARPNSPWRFGSRQPHAVTESGSKVYKRFIEVTRADVSRVTDFIKVFWQELDSLKSQIKAEWESVPQNANKDWDKYLADFGAWTEKANGALELVKNVSDAISSLMANPLTVLTTSTSMGGRDRSTPITRDAGFSTMRGRMVRVQEQALLLKESVKLMIKTVVDALREALDDPSISAGMPGVEKVARLNDLALSIQTITSALDTIRTSFPQRDAMVGTDDDVFLSRVQTFVDGVSMLGQITIPAWIAHGTVEAGVLAQLVGMLAAIQDFRLPNDFVRMIDALERLGDALGGLGGGLGGINVGGLGVSGGGGVMAAPGPQAQPNVNVDVSVAPPTFNGVLVLPNGSIPLIAELAWSRPPRAGRSSSGSYTYMGSIP